MQTLFLAQANNNAGETIAGLMIIFGAVWFLAYLCRPGRKGFDIEHKGKTTVRPK